MKGDLEIFDTAPWNRMLSKYFLRPHKTPTAQLAALIDSGKKFDYRKTLYYQIRSGHLIFGDRRISKVPKEAVWWDMPWLRAPNASPPKKKRHLIMMAQLYYFKQLFRSIQKRFDINRQRIRCDKLIHDGEVCFIYRDGSRRMGILGYLIHSGQMKPIKQIPVTLKCMASNWDCKWMDEKTARKLFLYPFRVLSRQ